MLVGVLRRSVVSEAFSDGVRAILAKTLSADKRPCGSACGLVAAREMGGYSTRSWGVDLGRFGALPWGFPGYLAERLCRLRRPATQSADFASFGAAFLRLRLSRGCARWRCGELVFRRGVVPVAFGGAGGACGCWGRSGEQTGRVITGWAVEGAAEVAEQPCPRSGPAARRFTGTGVDLSSCVGIPHPGGRAEGCVRCYGAAACAATRWPPGWGDASGDGRAPPPHVLMYAGGRGGLARRRCRSHSLNQCGRRPLTSALVRAAAATLDTRREAVHRAAVAIIESGEARP